MSEMQQRALEYIKNTNGGATLEIFKEDHEPVGDRLWDDLDFADMVYIDDNDKVRLLQKGVDALNGVNHE